MGDLTFQTEQASYMGVGGVGWAALSDTFDLPGGSLVWGLVLLVLGFSALIGGVAVSMKLQQKSD